MNNLIETRRADPIEDALNTLPLARVPASLQPGVMRKVRALATTPPFSIGWLDTALCLFAAAMLSLMMFMATKLSAVDFIRIRQSILIVYQQPFGGWAIGGLLAAAAICSALLFLSFRLFLQSRHRRVLLRR